MKLTRIELISACPEGITSSDRPPGRQATGAVTGILDRLEEAGFVERLRDSEDRRRIFVKLLPSAGAKLAGLYEGLGTAMGQLASRYTVKDLQLIEEFLAANLDILKQEIAKFTPKTAGSVT
jgi:DNA-binding MarR family transcriptional regulator